MADNKKLSPIGVKNIWSAKIELANKIGEKSLVSQEIVKNFLISFWRLKKTNAAEIIVEYAAAMIPYSGINNMFKVPFNANAIAFILSM